MKLLSALGDLRKKLGNKRGNEGPSLPPTDTSGITENKAVPTEDQCPMKALNIHRNAGGSRNSSTVSHLSTSEVDRAASLQLCQHPPYVEPWRNIQFADLCRVSYLHATRACSSAPRASCPTRLAILLAPGSASDKIKLKA